MSKKTYKNGNTVKLTKKEAKALQPAITESRVAQVAFNQASRMVETATRGLYARLWEVKPELKDYNVVGEGNEDGSMEFRVLYRKEAIDND